MLLKTYQWWVLVFSEIHFLLHKLVYEWLHTSLFWKAKVNFIVLANQRLCHTSSSFWCVLHHKTWVGGYTPVGMMCVRKSCWCEVECSLMCWNNEIDFRFPKHLCEASFLLVWLCFKLSFYNAVEVGKHLQVIGSLILIQNIVFAYYSKYWIVRLFKSPLALH